MKWQILRRGNYSQGNITDGILQELTETFGVRGAIPIGIGHGQYFWDDSKPAEGWIDHEKDYGVDSKGNFVVHGVELFEPLKTAYEEGRYKKWSAVIGRSRKFNKVNDAYEYGKWELFAVDLLGRTAPAIAGLKDLTNQKKQAKLNKFSNQEINEINENLIKFSDGSEKEILVFSDDFQMDDEQSLYKEEEEKKQMDLEKRMKDLEAQFADKTAKLEDLEKENLSLSEENGKLKEDQEKQFSAFKASEVDKLDKVLSSVPEEMRKKLYSAIDATAGNKISYTEDEKEVSLYSVISEVVGQIAFSEKSDSAEKPEINEPESKTDEEEGKKVYASGYEAVEAIIS